MYEKKMIHPKPKMIHPGNKKSWSRNSSAKRKKLLLNYPFKTFDVNGSMDSGFFKSFDFVKGGADSLAGHTLGAVAVGLNAADKFGAGNGGAVITLAVFGNELADEILFDKVVALGGFHGRRFEESRATIRNGFADEDGEQCLLSGIGEEFIFQIWVEVGGIFSETLEEVHTNQTVLKGGVVGVLKFGHVVTAENKFVSGEAVGEKVFVEVAADKGVIAGEIFELGFVESGTGGDFVNESEAAVVEHSD